MPRTKRNPIQATAVLSALVLACLELLGLGFAASGQKDAPPEAKKDTADETTIRALIAELNDDSFDKREAAHKRLAAIRGSALAAIQKVAVETKDAEIRERATRLVQEIQETGLYVARTEFYHDFRNNGFPNENFYITGPDAAKRVKGEPKGLSVTLLAEKSFKYDGVGVAAKFGITGDFELTAGFEIVEADPPKEGRGVYFELCLLSMPSSLPTAAAL